MAGRPSCTGSSTVRRSARWSPEAVRDGELAAVGIGQLDGTDSDAAKPRRTQPNQSIDLNPEVAVGHEIEALPIPPQLRRQRRAAPRDLRTTLRGLDRGLLILIPHQKPTQHPPPRKAQPSRRPPQPPPPGRSSP